MSVLRDDRLAALNELLVRCMDAGLHYRDAAEWAPESALSALFNELAEQRQAAAGELSDHIRSLGDLPDALDVDRESFSRVAALLKASVADDPGALSEHLSQQASRLERRIVEQAEYSLATEISGPVRASVQRLRNSAQIGLRRLER